MNVFFGIDDWKFGRVYLYLAGYISKMIFRYLMGRDVLMICFDGNYLGKLNGIYCVDILGIFDRIY